MARPPVHFGAAAGPGWFGPTQITLDAGMDQVSTLVRARRNDREFTTFPAWIGIHDLNEQCPHVVLVAPLVNDFNHQLRRNRRKEGADVLNTLPWRMFQ